MQKGLGGGGLIKIRRPKGGGAKNILDVVGLGGGGGEGGPKIGQNWWTSYVYDPLEKLRLREIISVK